jgi:hypothetical protein
MTTLGQSKQCIHISNGSTHFMSWFEWPHPLNQNEILIASRVMQQCKKTGTPYDYLPKQNLGIILILSLFWKLLLLYCIWQLSRLITNICFYVTLSTWIKAVFKKVLMLPSNLIGPFGLCAQPIQVGIIITFVYTYHFNYHCK